MNRIGRKGITAMLALTLVAGCADMNRETTGAVVGGATGGAVGSIVGKGEGRIAAIIVGTLVGTLVGATIGRYMDQQDRERTARVLEYNHTGQPTAWRNPDTGNRYEVTPTHTYYSGQEPCREFSVNANIEGRPQEVTGNACRQPDGRWKMVP